MSNHIASLKELSIKVILSSKTLPIKKSSIPLDVIDLINNYNRICWFCKSNNANYINWGNCYNSFNKGFVTILCISCYEEKLNKFKTSITHCFSCYSKKHTYINDITLDKYYLSDGNYTNLCSLCISDVINCISKGNEFKITHIGVNEKYKITFLPFKNKK